MQWLPEKFPKFNVQRHLQRLQLNSVNQSTLRYVRILKLDERFEQAESIPGIREMHCIEPMQRGQLVGK